MGRSAAMILTFMLAFGTVVPCPRNGDSRPRTKMKSQDVLLLLKLVSLSKSDRTGDKYLDSRWQDWETEETAPTLEVAASGLEDLDHLHLRPLATHEHSSAAQYGIRPLAEMTGISKSQVSLSLARCYKSGLAKPDRLTGLPKANTTALAEFLVYGLRYVFPASIGPLTRGIATAWAAPVLAETVLSGGEMPLVWPDPRGKTKGQALEPIYKTVPLAVKKDSMLYSLLALTDAIRIGQARERSIAIDVLNRMLEPPRV